MTIKEAKNVKIGDFVKIINTHKKGERLEGENYTNGNLNRKI